MKPGRRLKDGSLENDIVPESIMAFLVPCSKEVWKRIHQEVRDPYDSQADHGEAVFLQLQEL